MQNDPEVCGGFLLVRTIAQSAMASVHLAVRLGDPSGRPLVLKRPPFGERPSGRAAQALLREAEVLAEVRGAGLPALEAAGDIAGLPYVAIERLRGASLQKVLASGGPLPIAAVRAVGKDVARALARLHDAGWVHRDVTPSNVFIDDAGEAFLIDFGLCARIGGERDGSVAGTPGYAAPEAATPGAARPAQDVYGLAVCLAEAASGRRLFEETNLVEAAARGDAPPPAAALEPDLPGISAALRRDPTARPSAADLGAGLGPEGERAALAERATSADAPPALSQAAGLPREALDEAERPPAPAPALLTPTVAMPAVAAVSTAASSGVLPTLRDVPAPAPERPRSRAPLLLAGAALALLALLIGFFSGRFSARSRASSFSISGQLPKRTELLLDNKKLTVADGVPMPVPPGSHLLTIASPKTGKREISFNVRPGEHIVIVSPGRAAAADTATVPDDP